MAGHTYERVWIGDGAAAILGDHVTQNFSDYFLHQFVALANVSQVGSPEASVNIDNLSRNLAATAGLCEAILVRLSSSKGHDTVLLDLIDEATQLRDVLETLQIILDENYRGGFSGPNKCLQYLYEISGELSRYDVLLHEALEQLYSPFAAASSVGASTTIPLDPFVSLKKSLKLLWRKASITTAMLNVCVQRDWHHSQESSHERLCEKIEECESRIGTLLDAIENGHSHSLNIPLGLELSTANLQRAELGDDPMYLLQRHLDLRPSAATPSMQISPLRSCSTSAYASFWTARQQSTLLSTRHSIYQRQLQIFIKHAPGIHTLLVSVSLDDTVENLKDLIYETIGTTRFMFSLMFQGRRLNVSLTLRDAGIRSLATLNCIGIRTSHPRSGFLPPVRCLVEMPDGHRSWFPTSDNKPYTCGTVTDLKAEIKLAEGHPLARQQLMVDGTELLETEELPMSGTIIRLQLRPEEDLLPCPYKDCVCRKSYYTSFEQLRGHLHRCHSDLEHVYDIKPLKKSNFYVVICPSISIFEEQGPYLIKTVEPDMAKLLKYYLNELEKWALKTGRLRRSSYPLIFANLSQLVEGLDKEKLIPVAIKVLEKSHTTAPKATNFVQALAIAELVTSIARIRSA